MMCTSKFQHTYKAKRIKYLWVAIDIRYLITQEREARRMELCFSQDLDIQRNCRCKFHSRFPNYPVLARWHVLTDD